MRAFLFDEVKRIQREAAGPDLNGPEKAKIKSHLDAIDEIDATEELRSALNTGDYDGLSPLATKRLKKLRDEKAGAGEVATMIAQIQGRPTPPIGASDAGAGGSFAGAVKSAGFDLKANPSVELSTCRALHVKASTYPDSDTWNRLAPVIVPEGQDQRWLFRHLPLQDASTVTAVQDFKQTARTLTGTVQRALDATSTKADVAVTLTHVVEELSEWAVTISDIPNAILESVSSMTAFLQGEGEFQVNKAIDAHVISQIDTAGVAGIVDGSDLITQVRNAVALMRADGANPTLLALDPADAADLDLATSGTNTPYLFPTRDTGQASPLFGLEVVESVSMIGKNPMLLDPEMLGVMFLGALRFAADPFSGFKQNLTTLRIETHGLYHVRNILGAFSIGSS